MKRQLSRITAKGDSAEVLIYEDIGEGFFGGLGAKAFVEQLAALGSVKTLTVRINSDGGAVFEGMAIYNALKSHPATVNVVVDGIAASIASVIAMAGDTIQMQPTAMMMIHNARTMTYGDPTALREVAALLETVSGQMAIAYQRSGIDPVRVRSIMDAETWYTADAAVAEGWADGLVETPLKMAASASGYDLKAFKNVPKSLQNRVKAAKISANSENSGVSCTCPCPECLLGDCGDCSDPDCTCEGCTCDAAMGASAEASQIAAQVQQNALIAVSIRDRNLRLADLD